MAFLDSPPFRTATAKVIMWNFVYFSGNGQAGRERNGGYEDLLVKIPLTCKTNVKITDSQYTEA